VSLSASALVTLAEVKQHLGIPAGAEAKSPLLEEIANRASDAVAEYLDRQLINVASITEYHSLRTPAGQPVVSSVLQTRQWPIVTVTSVHESTGWPRTYGASELLVADTDYTVSKPAGKLYRLESSIANWATGFRTVKVVYTAGYTQATVPARIKAVVLRLCAVMWAEVDRALFGVSTQSDQLGNFTRFAPARLTDDMKADLVAERRSRLYDTGEVDA